MARRRKCVIILVLSLTDSMAVPINGSINITGVYKKKMLMLNEVYEYV